MAATPKALDLVDMKSKCVVFGYTRSISKLFGLNIPTPIISICLLYYFEGDDWDQELVGWAMKVDENRCCIKEDHNGDCSTSYLKKKFDSGFHLWTFKVVNVCVDNDSDNLGKWTTTIGLWPVSHDDYTPSTKGVFVDHGMIFIY